MNRVLSSVNEFLQRTAETHRHWGRVPAAVGWCGLSRSELYNLIKEGKIESFVYKSRPDAVSGVRMINLDSLTAFLDVDQLL